MLSSRFVCSAYSVALVDKHVELPDVNMHLYEPHHEWLLDSARVERRFIRTSDVTRQPTVQLRLSLSRNPRYFFLNTVVPCVVVTLMSVLVFALPSESGEKVSLSVTVLLSYTVLLLIISDVSPRNGDSVPLLSTRRRRNTVLVPVISELA